MNTVYGIKRLKIPAFAVSSSKIPPLGSSIITLIVT
jgi:hypothetical protein